MIEFLTATLDALSVHKVGSHAEDEGVHLSDKNVELQDEILKNLLLKYFFSSFKEPEFYAFSFSSEDIKLNPLFNYASAIFDNPEQLHQQSALITQYLYDRSSHPNIKSGDLLVAYIKEVLIEDEVADAIAIFKSESKDDFIQLKDSGNGYVVDYDKGVNIEKLDKGCLIFNTEKATGYKLCVIDNSNKYKEAVYWKSDFLNVKQRSDSYHATSNYIQMTKSFVKERLKPLYELDKTDEAAIMNRSKDFFHHQEEFDQATYEENIFKNKEYVADFQEYKLDYQEEKSIPLPDHFNINEQAVKKQSRVFKSILKLDKNFHIYIHGNRDMIEKGTDENGRKYYKIYYESES